MAYRTGVSTSRGLSSLADHVGVSPVPLFDRVLRVGAALEIGRGEGRALLELQQRHPATRCVCLNYAGWKGGWGQGVGGGAQASADAATLRGMGAHYGLSLAADARLPDERYARRRASEPSRRRARGPCSARPTWTRWARGWTLRRVQTYSV